MEQFFASPKAGVAVMFMVFAVAGLIAWAWYYWLKYRQAEMSAALKEEMIHRGMSADDIVRVLEAGQPKDKDAAALTQHSQSSAEGL